MFGSALAQRQLFKRSPLFSCLGDKETDAMLAHAHTTLYEAGDEIYVFGFSRGAFCARSFAGLVGCGKSELIRAIYGIEPAISGTIRTSRRSIRSTSACPRRRSGRGAGSCS